MSLKSRNRNPKGIEKGNKNKRKLENWDHYVVFPSWPSIFSVALLPPSHAHGNHSRSHDYRIMRHAHAHARQAGGVLLVHVTFMS
jgi:hypothetical protein